MKLEERRAVLLLVTPSSARRWSRKSKEIEEIESMAIREISTFCSAQHSQPHSSRSRTGVVGVSGRTRSVFRLTMKLKRGRLSLKLASIQASTSIFTASQLNCALDSNRDFASRSK